MARRKKPAPRKRGPMGEKEKTATALILDLNPAASFEAIAKILGRKTSSIHNYVTASRDMLRYAAPRYLELHMKAATIAASQGNASPAQWALERIEATNDEGEKVRVVEAPAGGDRNAGSVGNGLTVNVGIALSQVSPTDPPQITITQEANPSALLPAEHEPIDLSALVSDD